MVKAAPDGAAGPAPASRALPWEARPGRTPGHPPWDAADWMAPIGTGGMLDSAFLAPDYPARGHRI
jgi:hypothetical protein